MYNKIKDFCNFEEGKAYVLMLIPRKKENGNNTERDKLNLLQRKIIQNENDLLDALHYFEDFTSRYPNIVFRLYITANRRCLTKALFSIQEKIARMTKDLFFGNKEVFNRVTNLSTELKSTLAQNDCRDTKNFLFDVDYSNNTSAGRRAYLELLEVVKKFTTVLYNGKTLNNFVIVTEPFNPLLLKEKYPDANGMIIIKDLVEIKPDAMLYITVYNNGEN